MTNPTDRNPSWKWIVCGLLLCASTINYMDRVTLSTIATRITAQFGLTQEQYGNLEFGFGWAFAAGSLFWGLLVDRLPVRWVYPAVLMLWSTVGFLTAYAGNYHELLFCRILLGLFEGGHWPCAIKTTRALLDPARRSFGNSMLQSGTSIGAIATPLVMRLLLSPDPGSWRIAFQIIGAAGLLWMVAWFALIRSGDLRTPADEPGSPVTAGASGSLWEAIFSRRMLVVLVVIALINTWWQLLRAWLPKVLQEGRGYAEADVLAFLPVFYIATDLGVFAAGAATLWLNRRGMSVHGARVAAFAVCAALSAFAVAAAVLPRGPALFGVLLLAGAGALGVFPIYHALTQEFTSRHQGTISGLGGVAAWALSPAQKYYGRLVDQTGSFDLGFAVAGCFPILAFAVLWLLWKPVPEPTRAGDTP
ncbi:MAG: MFS transporter [Candidatus Latescibacterota bacterium]|jgi:predicted MFS family arabinose efflux permease